MRVSERDVARWLGVSADRAEREIERARARLQDWLRVCEVAEESSPAEAIGEEAYEALCARLPLREAIPNFGREAAARVVNRCPKELRALLAHRESTI